MSFVKHREFRAATHRPRKRVRYCLRRSSSGENETQPHDDSPGLSGLYAPLYFFLGAEWLLVFMVVSAMLGTGIGSLGGKFLEGKLRTRQIAVYESHVPALAGGLDLHLGKFKGD
jgi:hypothetical protein